MGRTAALAAAALFLGAGGASADVAGSRDHPLIPRYEGSVIEVYDQREYDEYLVRLAADPDAAKATSWLEGRLTRITYAAPEDRSVLEVYRNYEAALREIGIRPMFTCDREECGTLVRAFADYNYLLNTQGEHRYLVGRADRPEGALTVALWVGRSYSGGRLRDRTMAHLYILEGAPMEERMVFVDVGTMQRELGEAGRVALYGLHFDFDRDTITADSEPQLEAIAAMLREAPDLRVMVVGHTDATGSADYNLDLSRRRAANVVATLTGRFGIDGGRLSATGVGMAAPVASNRTPEGQALNRRVELVEW